MTNENEKAVQIFSFAKALNELKYPVVKDMSSYDWKLNLHDLPAFKTISIDRPFDNGVDMQEIGEYLLKVGRPALTGAPEMPEALNSWINGDWKDPFANISIVKEKNEICSNCKNHEYYKNCKSRTTLVKFEEDPARQEAFALWNQKREAWRETECPARRAYDLYEKIFAAYTRLAREGDGIELMLGDGYFRSLPDGIDHPVLLMRLQINFDPSAPLFTVEASENPTILNSRLLRQISNIDAGKISDFEQKIDEEGIYPYDGQEVNDILMEMANSFSPDGRFLKQGGHDNQTDTELVSYRNPVFFIRKRESNFLSTLDAIVGDLKTDAQLPSPIVNITGISTPDRESNSVPDDSIESKLLGVNGISQDVLFAKPANEAQLQIARKIERSNAVLVQGPPGTGKTHTIANLIGHFMGQGKSVLVTSYTAKALKVLKDKIPESLQPLCVSIIEENNQQLENAVNAINDHLTRDNSEALRHSATQLEIERNEALAQLCQAKIDLKTIIESEYQEITIEGGGYSPKDAAVYVKEHSQTLGWVPGKIEPFSPLPLINEELAELYETNAQINPDIENELDFYIPESDQLISPEKFSEMIETINSYDDVDKSLWQEIDEISSDKLNEILIEVRKSAGLLDSKAEWKVFAAFCGANRELYFDPWQEFIETQNELLVFGAKLQKALIDYDIEFPVEFINDNTLILINEIIEAADGIKGVSKLTLAFKSEWKRFIKSCRINGSEPRGKRDFEVLSEFCAYKLKQEKTKKYFQKLITNYGGPDINDENHVELIIREMIPEIQTCLDWSNQRWNTLISSLVEAGFDWNGFYQQLPNITSPYGEIEKAINALSDPLPASIHAEYRRHLSKEIEEELMEYRNKLNRDGIALSVQKLIKALDRNDTETYEKAYYNISNLWSFVPVYLRRKELMQKLSSKALEWSDNIKHRVGIHGNSQMPNSPKEAWVWLQLKQELDRRGALDLKEVQFRINRLNNTLMQITEQLLAKRAWYHELESVSNLSRRQALAGWADMVKMMGRGTGKRAKILLQQVKQQMKLCKDSVPVWIMPLNKVIENFIPGETKFDVVIIDEASQADVTGLIALYFGKKSIIVGDDKQVSPETFGFEVDQITQLQDQYLQRIMNQRLYNERLSLYDMAKWSFDPIVLEEHFRCVNQIIGFSNHYIYSGKIKSLRDDSTVRIRPATVAFKIEGCRDSNKTNFKEAEMIVGLIKACIEQPEYKDASIGVISMLGSEQAALIDEMLRKGLNEFLYQKHQIQCGTPPSFQGDERDVVFLSMVDSPNEKSGPLGLKQEGYMGVNSKRFNVAASRARDQMWVVYSLNPDIDLKPGDIREQLIHYAINPDAIEQRIEKNSELAESVFETGVIRSLTMHEYDVYPQWHVGEYRIDIVVEYQGKRIAIECDGERWHGPDQLMADMARQSVLERLGWRFIRIRGSSYFRDPEGTMDDVFEQLSHYGILSSTQRVACEETKNSGLKDKIIKRSYEIIESTHPDKYDTSNQKDNAKNKMTELQSDSNIVNVVRELNQTQSAEKPSQPSKVEPQIGNEKSEKKLITVDFSRRETKREKSKTQKIDTRIDHSNLDHRENFDVVQYLKNQGLTVIDSRKSSFLIWVLGDSDIQKIMLDLKQKGYIFIFEKRGSIATNNQPAWRCAIR